MNSEQLESRLEKIEDMIRDYAGCGCCGGHTSMSEILREIEGLAYDFREKGKET